MQKIIFLDLDGVLILKNDAFNEDCQNCLGTIIKSTGARIVVSSMRRRATPEDTKTYLRILGFYFCDQVIDVTIRGKDHLKEDSDLYVPRGIEIKYWVDAHLISADKYVIIDDTPDMLLEQRPYFVHTLHKKGLSISDAYKAIKILNG